MSFYPDEELNNCPECGGLGMLGKNIWGKIEFLHKIPSPRFEGYFTFTAEHKMSVAQARIKTKKGKLMNNYPTPTDFLKMSLVEIENTLTAYLKIAEDSDWDITRDFENDLRMLTNLAKAKGSTKKWQQPNGVST